MTEKARRSVTGGCTAVLLVAARHHAMHKCTRSKSVQRIRLCKVDSHVTAEKLGHERSVASSQLAAGYCNSGKCINRKASLVSTFSLSISAQSGSVVNCCSRF
ncbi:TPA: hypothetical protein ACH3X1_013945 [Trebouxia sp. C0004]